MDESTQKTCSLCQQELSRDAFNRRAASRDGLQAKCRTCESARKRLMRSLSPKARAAANLRAIRKAQNAAVAEKACSACAVVKDIAEFHRTSDGSKGGRRATCKACDKIWHAENYRRNREALLGRNRAWREANPEQCADAARRYYESNKDAIYQRHREWVARNPLWISEFQNRRRAAMRGSMTEPVDPESIWTGTCGICGNALDRSARHPDPLSPSLDHIVPVSRGGAHVVANLQWAHLICNIRKGARMPTDAA